MASTPRKSRIAATGRARLDQPIAPRRLARISVDPDAAGRMSERIARFLGSWRFIGYMSAFVVAWVLWNVIAPESLRFDEWPFIGLTLLLSLQASYAAPLILLSQNRQTDRDRIQYQEDQQATLRLVADAEYLAREVADLRISMGEVATREFIRGELEDLADNINAGRDRQPSEERSKPKGSGGTKRNKRTS
jgi:uncharacterized membrane protein